MADSIVMTDKNNTLFGDAVMGKLADRFIAPPFSVLDTKCAAWMKRKAYWRKVLATGKDIDSSTATDPMMRASLYKSNERSKRGKGGNWQSYSRFDPVLAELMLQWFCPDNGSVLDPFAGESVKGIIAGMTKHPYTGVEIRKQQVKENMQLASGLDIVTSKWVCGDSVRIKKLIEKGTKYDMVFTSPPYYDLEVYSTDDKDGSTAQTYDEFMHWLGLIYKRTISFLDDNRFVVLKVGDVRDKTQGHLYNFVGDTISVCQNMGLQFWNGMILLTAMGTAAMRVHKLVNRKIVRVHQHVLVFYKGDPKSIPENFRKL